MVNTSTPEIVRSPPRNRQSRSISLASAQIPGFYNLRRAARTDSSSAAWTVGQRFGVAEGTREAIFEHCQPVGVLGQLTDPRVRTVVVERRDRRGRMVPNWSSPRSVCTAGG